MISAGDLTRIVADLIAGLGVGVFAMVADGWSCGQELVVVVVVKDGCAFERLALGDANEEVVGAEASVWNEREGDRREVEAGFARAAAGARPFGRRTCDAVASGGRHRRGGL